jgi:Sulfotransferase domain
VPPEMQPWFESMRGFLDARFCAEFDNPAAMMDAFEQHNDAVRAAVPPDRLLEWTATDGWDPLCERLGVPVPDEPFPLTNQTTVWRENFGMPPI